jgi:uncharacterized protein (TIGR03086 family)
VSEQVDLLDAVLTKTAALLAGTPAGTRSQPTPCPGFDVEGLVDHLATWMATFAESAAGSPPPGTTTDASWPEPEAERFRVAARHAVDAFRDGAEERSLTLTSGPVPGSMVLGMMLMEYVGHGWDLAVATGQPVPFVDAEAEAALAAGRQMLSPEYRGPDKSFGHEIPVPAEAPAVDRLIGFLGRSPAGTG